MSYVIGALREIKAIKYAMIYYARYQALDLRLHRRRFG